MSDDTKHVSDGPAALRHVADGRDATRHVSDGPDSTRHVSDGPLPLGAAPPTGLPRFGRFQATAELGAGAMGTVYRAHDDVLGRDVAIKALHASGALGLRERFVREARAIGAVMHPNILGIYDVGGEATPYLVMELAPGGSLRERVKAGTLPVTEVRELGIQIARALAAAHAAHIVHRDVKPANILSAQQGTWKLADFGIARLPDSTLTVEGQFLGSPSYAAPESLRAGQFSAASDVYSLGATLYEALAGTPPYGDHDMQSLVRKLEHEPAPLQQRRSVPAPLASAIMSALARDPASRPSADELARRLAATEDAAAPIPARAPAPAPTGSPAIKWLAAGLAAIAVLAVVLAVKSRSQPAHTVPGVTRPIERAAPARPDEPAESRDHDERRKAGGADERRKAGGADEAGEPGEPGEPDEPEEAQPPMFVDRFGQPVDDEAAKEILEQMERDARASFRRHERGRGRGRRNKD